MPAIGAINSLIFQRRKGKNDEETHEEGEIGPEVDEVSVGEDGIGLAQLLIDQIHNQRQVVLAAVAHVLYLRRIELRRHEKKNPAFNQRCGAVVRWRR